MSLPPSPSKSSSANAEDGKSTGKSKPDPKLKSKPAADKKIGFFDRVIRWLSQTFGSGSEDASDIQKIINQTERVSMRLFLIASTVLVALLVAGWLRKNPDFVIWGLGGALAAAMVGGAIGVLFGLPTVEAKREAIAATHPVANLNSPATAPAGASTSVIDNTATPPTDDAAKAAGIATKREEFETGYRDSTSLEQIADWLTKILIGLTLTQYNSWEHRFQQLSSNLTEAMLGPRTGESICGQLIKDLSGPKLVAALELEPCRASAVPGGIIIALFATVGFLISYLWMRRYFILEMVIAKKQARELFAAKREEIRGEAELIRQRNDAQMRDAATAQKAAEQQKTIGHARDAEFAEPSRGRAAITDPEVNAIMERGLERVAAGSKAEAALLRVKKKVANTTTDPDDPWRGMFGEALAAGNAFLAAKVSPIANDPYFFEVQLCVHAATDKSRSELAGTKVLYFVHPTFGDHPKISSFGSDGTAPLELYAYGAFTVGALLEDGTLLEFNLATLEGAPARFLSQ